MESKKFERSWTEIERPVGDIVLPDWIGAVHVDWMEKFGNSPHVLFKQVRAMPELGPWRKEGAKRWVRESADKSIVEQHWHNGAVSRAGDHYTTTRQEGYGGRTFVLEQVEGFDAPVHLVGPWFGGTPAGFSELTWVECTGGEPRRDRDTPWFERGGYFGKYISDDLLIRALTKLVPDVRIARVKMYAGESGDRVQPFKSEWGCPKDFRNVKEKGE